MYRGKINCINYELLNNKNIFLKVVSRVCSILSEKVFTILLTQSADVLTAYSCPRIRGCYQGDIQNEVIIEVCCLDAVSPEVDYSVIRTSVSSVLYIMCSFEASISQVWSEMFKSLLHLQDYTSKTATSHSYTRVFSSENW